ncbi:alpha/beta hydrolase [Riemerella anatipestifer]|nr:alpha/beta hydrolase [Riemerella anatipestifer]
MKRILLSLVSVALVSCKTNTVLDASQLEFDISNYKTETVSYQGKSFKVRAYENIVYVSNPVDTSFQKMNIYIPEEYFEGKKINGYTADTAPIFYPNQVGGYMPAQPSSLKGKAFNPPINGGAGRQLPRIEGNINKENTVVAALSIGYVVASAGARGRANKDNKGKYYGKAPAGLVDLKAGIRYLRFNDDKMPGDANKIISNGTSAGGAMSALLGSTGNHPDYNDYLNAIGAANTSDVIFASSDYCPITNLEYADMAYEWQFNGVNSYQKRVGFGSSEKELLNDKQQNLSNHLKNEFPSYVNTLNLKDEKGNKLTLGTDGNGSFKDFIKSQVIISANEAIKKGKDLSHHKFIKFNNGVVVDLDWEGYINYMERQKTPPAFDALTADSAENILFGTENVDAQHFTTFSQKYSEVKTVTKADDFVVKLMNPMKYIGDSKAEKAKYWRIRHGSKDKDTSLAISSMLALCLRNQGYNVDYALPWDILHSGDYDLKELFDWIDSISK